MGTSRIAMKSVIPIFRIFDVDKAKEFYLDYLGFKINWEHQFEDDMPIYMQVSYDDCVIHLTEHYGDGSPGAAIRVEVENIKKLHSNLFAKKYKYARPGLEKGPGNTQEISVNDPFGNKIVFFEEIESAD